MRLPLVLVSTLLLVLPGCAAASRTPPRAATQPFDPATQGVPKPAWKRSCREYAGAPVDITYQDASGGAAVVYRTKGNVERLRERTEEVARFHNSAAGKAPDLHDLYRIPHNARVENLSGGAKLVLVPKSLDPSLLEDLRRNVQQEVSNMRRKGCGRGQEAL
jgi:hypothetical protein